MANCNITGKLYEPDGVALLTNKKFQFLIRNVGTDNTNGYIYPRGYLDATTDSSGDVKAADGTSTLTLWVNGDSDSESLYEFIGPKPYKESVTFIIPTGTTDADIADCLSTYRAEASSQNNTIYADAIQRSNHTGDEDLNGSNSLILDADGDTKVQSSVDDQIVVTIGGSAVLTLTAANAALLEDLIGLAPTFGNMIVGNGITWVVESGNTVLTSLGVLTNSNTTVKLGSSVSVSGPGQIAIGQSANVSGSSGTAIGKDSICSGNDSVAVGAGSEANGLESAAFGRLAKAENSGSVAVGSGAISGANFAIQIGQGSNATANSIQITNWGVVDSGTWGFLSRKLVSVASVGTSTTLSNHSDQTVKQTASGITSTLYASPTNGDKVTIINYSGGSNTIAGNGKNIVSSDVDSDASVTILNNEVLKIIYDGTSWLLTT